MDRDSIKNLVCLLLFLAFVGLTVLLTLVDINTGIIDFSSIKGIVAKREELLELEEKLEKTEDNYSDSKKSLVNAQNSFTTAKNKYEAISDETINLIKEATTEENYDIEYMWIRLGNYALANNLQIVMVEPGGQNTTTEQNTNNQNTTDQTQNNNSNETESSTTTTTTNSDTLMTVTVQGSYMNVSDFVFEVENDKELRFKLDNIVMTYVEGTIIKAKFDVKNVIVLK